MDSERDTVFLDVETTGVDPMVDRIVELGLIRINTGGTVARINERFNPQRQISPEATAVHGITDTDVANCPTFAERAGEMLLNFVGASYCGYNLRRLDLPILDQEFRRAGFARGLPLHGAVILDCYGIWAAMAPRTLENAVQEFCGRKHEGAHGALADALATMDVMGGLMARWPQLARMPEEEIDKLGNFGRIGADLAGKLYRDPDGDLRYSFGKAKDVKVRDDLGYANWMLHKANFPANTNEVLEAELDRLDRETRGGASLFEDVNGPYKEGR